MTTRILCDLCERELKEQTDRYYFKLYKVFISNEFFTVKQICRPCHDKILKFAEKLER